MSRHNPHPRQLDELRRMYGSGTVIEQEVHPFDDAHQIARRFREGDYGVMVVVAPLSVISVLCTEGVPMLWSVATEENDPAKVEPRSSSEGRAGRVSASFASGGSSGWPSSTRTTSGTTATVLGAFFRKNVPASTFRHGFTPCFLYVYFSKSCKHPRTYVIILPKPQS